ncbi:BPSL0761 family protein [Variovorax sp. dw_308]|uniref:BPSL0761 family protein n=1 Tax=Variovorax sp. dw_308 TaxID=2721546 RepID=UPI001C48A74A|nr:BPSL0761 family protein [Variovorax sp. dw_308]
MTMGYERRRAMEWAGETLRDLVYQREKEKELWGGPVPPKLRELAKRILRHYPEPWQIDMAAQSEEPLNSWISEEPER